ncbi:MAG TPA: DciA family protein [Magnetospirillaceae bacterium]|nr:DciA family protein [Magnetospirillaceae bacterium]
MQDRTLPGPKAIAEFSRQLTKQPLGKRGFSEVSLITNWPEIVGQAQALGSVPLKIAFPREERSGGTLHVRVSTGGLATEFQYRKELIISRINSHFGYGAVADLRITQGHVPPRMPRKKTPPPPVLPAEQENDLQQRLAGVEDDEMREALAKLGRRLAARQ